MGLIRAGLEERVQGSLVNMSREVDIPQGATLDACQSPLDVRCQRPCLLDEQHSSLARMIRS